MYRARRTSVRGKRVFQHRDAAGTAALRAFPCWPANKQSWVRQFVTRDAVGRGAGVFRRSSNGSADGSNDPWWMRPESAAGGYRMVPERALSAHRADAARGSRRGPGASAPRGTDPDLHAGTENDPRPVRHQREPVTGIGHPTPAILPSGFATGFRGYRGPGKNRSEIEAETIRDEARVGRHGESTAARGAAVGVRAAGDGIGERGRQAGGSPEPDRKAGASGYPWARRWSASRWPSLERPARSSGSTRVTV